MKPTLRHALAATILVLALAAPVAAGALEDVYDAYDRGDYAAALRLLRPLVNQSDADAQFILGLMYARGQGVPQDYVRAHMWFNLAAAQDYQLAAGQRNSIARRMTRAQIAEAQKLAREWRPAP
jgi:TPR repeat protein